MRMLEVISPRTTPSRSRLVKTISAGSFLDFSILVEAWLRIGVADGSVACAWIRRLHARCILAASLECSCEGFLGKGALHAQLSVASGLQRRCCVGHDQETAEPGRSGTQVD